MQCDVEQLLDVGGEVLVADLPHLQQTTLLSLDTIKERWVREFELVVFGGLEGVVRFSLGDSLDEGFEVAGVTPELETIDVEDVGDDVVEEARVVGNDD